MGKKKIQRSKKTEPVEKEKSASASKPKMGTPDRPYQFDNPYFDVSDVKEGVYESFAVEYLVKGQRKRDDRWMTFGVCSTEKIALVEYRRAVKDQVTRVAGEREDQWYRDNTHAQKDQEQMVFKITAKTSAADFEKFTNLMKEKKTELKSNPPVKKPKSFKPQPGDKDYPEIRIRRIIVGVGSEDVTPA